MGLTRKTALVIGAGLLLLLGVVAALSLTMVMGGFRELERRQAGRNFDRLNEAVANVVANLNTKASDWSNWDDTYRFAVEAGPEFVDSNLTSDSIGLLGLCGLVIMNNEGQVVAAAGHNPDVEGVAPPDQALMRAIRASPDLWGPPAAGKFRAGLVRVDDGILAVAIRPILDSHGEGPTHGSIIFALRLDDDTRQHLADMIRAEVSWRACSAEEDSVAHPSPGAPPIVRTRDGRVEAAGVIPDIMGGPALYTEVSIPREVTAQGWQTVRFSLLVVIATGLLLGLATDRALRVLVLSRVARLSAELSGIAASGESARRVTARGTDELGLLATDVNNVLATLDRQAVELRRARRAAEDATRAKSDFLAAISHDVRSPLAVVLGSAELLAEGSVGEEERRQHLDAVARNVRHALVVVGDLLDHSKIEAGRMSVESIPCSPAEVVRESVAMVEQAARAKGLDVRVRIDDDLPATVLGDPTRLRQILMNLVGNAVKFTRTGWIEVRARAARAPSPAEGLPDRVRGGASPGRSAAAPGAWRLRFQVQDTGIGLSKEQIGSLFQAYSQADSSTARNFGGTGLGLSISRALARQMGGDLTADGTPGRGSTFTLEVAAEAVSASPALADAAESDDAGKARGGAGASSLAGLRILVADDSEDNLRLLAHNLRRMGAVVTTAQDGAEAVAHASHASEGLVFDAILLDLNMPGVDGRQAASRLRARGYAGRLILATASEDPRKSGRAGAELFDDVLIKPIAPGDLVAAVLRASAKSQRRAA